MKNNKAVVNSSAKQGFINTMMCAIAEYDHRVRSEHIKAGIARKNATYKCKSKI